MRYKRIIKRICVCRRLVQCKGMAGTCTLAEVHTGYKHISREIA